MEQIRILIGSIDDDDARNDMFRFWQKSLKRKDYNEESFLKNLLKNKINF